MRGGYRKITNGAPTEQKGYKCRKWVRKLWEESEGAAAGDENLALTLTLSQGARVFSEE